MKKEEKKKGEEDGGGGGREDIEEEVAVLPPFFIQTKDSLSLSPSLLLSRFSFIFYSRDSIR